MKPNGNSWKIKFRRVPHLDNIEIMHASNITHDYPPHIHEAFCLVSILRGTETHICRGKSYLAEAGDLMLINANESHSSKSVESEYKVLYIRPKELNRIAYEVTGRNSENLYFPDPVIKDASIFRLFLDLHLKLERKASPLEQESEYLSTVGFLIRRQNETHLNPELVGKEPHYVELVRDYLRSNYAENISLSKLAALTNLSPYHLLRVFRNQTGVPPHEFQTQVRIAHAGRLLRQGYSISDAALETGFFDQSHFSRNFKRITGMTPKYYSSHSNIIQYES